MRGTSPSRAANASGCWGRTAPHEPDLFVLDEPTASLDPDVALRVRTGLLAVCRELGTALLRVFRRWGLVSRVS